MYWWCLGWWDDSDEFSGVQDNKEHPITKKARLKTPKKNLIVILMHLLKIYKSKQIDEMMNDNVDKDDLFGYSIAAKIKEFPEMR